MQTVTVSVGGTSRPRSKPRPEDEPGSTIEAEAKLMPVFSPSPYHGFRGTYVHSGNGYRRIDGVEVKAAARRAGLEASD